MKAAYFINFIYTLERKSSSPSINSTSLEKNPFDDLPWHLLSQIFCTLELKERVIASQVYYDGTKLLSSMSKKLSKMSNFA
jgi:hypothetical protein